eukprot:COSAG06_NODE_782_length_12363_cov_27.005463_14_plen_61_part_00
MLPVDQTLLQVVRAIKAPDHLDNVVVAGQPADGDRRRHARLDPAPVVVVFVVLRRAVVDV